MAAAPVAMNISSASAEDYIVENAQALLTGKSQSAVDSGAKTLEQAIAALVKIDFTELQKAIEAGRGLIDTCAHGKLWYELFDLINGSDEVIKSRDQANVDQLAAKINDVIDRIQKDCPDCGAAETIVTVIKEVTVTVPVEPNDPYCNIGLHKIWTILFFIALALLLILAAFILFFFRKKRENEKDETPLVDYDIADDEGSEEDSEEKQE